MAFLVSYPRVLRTPEMLSYTFSQMMNKRCRLSFGAPPLRYDEFGRITQRGPTAQALGVSF